MHIRTSNQDTMKAEWYHWEKKKKRNQTQDFSFSKENIHATDTLESADSLLSNRTSHQV